MKPAASWPVTGHAPLAGKPSKNITLHLLQKRQSCWVCPVAGMSCGSTNTKPCATCGPPAGQTPFVGKPSKNIELHLLQNRQDVWPALAASKLSVYWPPSPLKTNDLRTT